MQLLQKTLFEQLIIYFQYFNWSILHRQERPLYNNAKFDELFLQYACICHNNFENVQDRAFGYVITNVFF